MGMDYCYALALKQVEKANLLNLDFKDKIKAIKSLIDKTPHTCGYAALAQVLSEDFKRAISERDLCEIAQAQTANHANVLISKITPIGEENV